MQYWAYINGEQKGPMELDQLLALNITHETLVWREGLETWIPAKDLSELSTILVIPAINEVGPPPIAQDMTNHQQNPQCGTNTGPTRATAPSQEYPRYAPGQQPYQEYRVPPCPPTNLIWAILSLICCCQVFGIIAVVYAAQVTSLYNSGRYEASRKASNNALTWSIASLVVGIIGYVISISVGIWDALYSYL